MTETPPGHTPLSQLQEARKDFLALVATLRPDLHRYCSRMVGSVIDGEDVVQETLARGYYELSALQNPPALRSWLFRIAHNRALDHLRRRRPTEPLDTEEDAADTDSDPNNLVPREQAITLAMARFLQLAPSQRSCVILKDVLDYSLEDISTSLDLSVPAVKAALHRGRTRLRTLSAPAEIDTAVSPTVHRYAQLFNARNWDAVRDMLIDDVKLEVLDATSRKGRKEVGVYFTRYANMQGWQVIPAILDGREGLAVLPTGSFVELTIQADRIAMIRDYFHIPYLTAECQPKIAG
ncbi:MAG TPA: RNA polymerase sigma factor [Steroidobacteraceae bacterium]